MNPTEISIRPSSPADAPAVVRLKDSTWLATYPRAVAGITRQDIQAHLDKEPIDSKIKRWRGYLTGSPTSRTWVAEFGTEIVGFISASKAPDGNQIQALYILPAHQRQGIGSQLIKTALDWLGDGEIWLRTVSYNFPAIAAYSKLGFALVENSEAKNLILPSGMALPEHKMIRKAKL